MLKTNQSPGSLNSNSNNNNNILSGGGQHSQLETTHGSKDLSNNSSMTDSPESSVRLLVGEFFYTSFSALFLFPYLSYSFVLFIKYVAEVKAKLVNQTGSVRIDLQLNEYLIFCPSSPRTLFIFLVFMMN